MIKVLGSKRLITIIILLAVNVVLAGAAYMYLMPENEAKNRELRIVRGQVSTLNNDLARLQVEFDQLEEQREAFGDLEKDGFFKDQGRREAEKVLNLIQERSKVSKAQVSIGRGEVEDNEEAKKAKHKILKSQIDVRVEAMNDVDVFRYIYLMEKYFPGHVGVEELSFERDAEVNGTVLRSIAAGTNVPLIKANISLIWRTMIPEEQIIGGEGQ